MFGIILTVLYVLSCIVLIMLCSCSREVGRVAAAFGGGEILRRLAREALRLFWLRSRSPQR